MAPRKAGDTAGYLNAGGYQQEAVGVVIFNADGTAYVPPSPPTLGRAAASASSPVALSNEDYARISQTYRRAAAVGAGGGDAVLVSGVTTAGTVSLTLVNGGTAVVSVPLGSSVLPFAATAASLGSALGGTFQNLFFT